jgi:hypothetical protein
MSVLNRVPQDIRELRSFIQDINSNRYYYYARDPYPIMDVDGGERVVPSQFVEWGNFKYVFVDIHGQPMYRFVNNKEKELHWIGYDGNLRDGNLAEFRSRIVYTDSPPAVGSIPLTYDDYAQMNNLQGGRKKTRNSKNRKPKITQKYKKRRGRR